jgi:thiol-disulfide isomerase/thioredoxin
MSCNRERAARFWTGSPYNDPDDDDERGDSTKGMIVFLVVLAVVGLVGCLLFKMFQPGGCGASSSGYVTGRIAGGAKGSTTLQSESELSDVVRKTGSGGFAVCMFHAPWCGHCKSAKPEFFAAAAESDIAIEFFDIDADAHMKPHLEKYKIKGFPTYKIFARGGDLEEVPPSARAKAQLLAYLRKLLASQ